jgi:hypothetical protein
VEMRGRKSKKKGSAGIIIDEKGWLRLEKEK